MKRSVITHKQAKSLKKTHPLIDVPSWHATDDRLLTMTMNYYLENCTFRDISASLERSLDKKQIAQLTEMVSVLIKDYEKKD